MGADESKAHVRPVLQHMRHPHSRMQDLVAHKDYYCGGREGGRVWGVFKQVHGIAHVGEMLYLLKHVLGCLASEAQPGILQHIDTMLSEDKNVRLT